MLNNRKAYAVDSDSNLVFTQDTIFLLKWNGKSRQKIEVTQQEFDQIKIDNKNWRRLNDNHRDSFQNFIEPGNYKKSLLEALNNGKTGPSRKKFIKANEKACPVAIITVRGQTPEELKESHRAVIYEILTEKERRSLTSNMQRNLNVRLSKDETIELYLNNNLYLPVESQEFLNMSGTNLEIPAKTRKNIGFEMFVGHVQNLFGEYYGEDFVDNPAFSIGFSDDNLQNIQSMVNFIKTDLLLKYPRVKFVVYNTNDSKKVKRIRMG